ncbi:hypothetical protein PC116_g2167 [Phytophthora cactorum]|nr:hypothetical protein PC114_g2239 [Phytophthora cactorum]KAG4250088.1 hypothetical protein PC116_g2167 [Phytophthora cactorum]
MAEAEGVEFRSSTPAAEAGRGHLMTGVAPPADTPSRFGSLPTFMDEQVQG